MVAGITETAGRMRGSTGEAEEELANGIKMMIKAAGEIRNSSSVAVHILQAQPARPTLIAMGRTGIAMIGMIRCCVLRIKSAGPGISWKETKTESGSAYEAAHASCTLVAPKPP